jgi:hypothetical protein
MSESGGELSQDSVRETFRAAGFRLDWIEKDPSVTCAIDDSFRIIYCNAQWDAFATANGAPELTGSSVLGTNLFDVIPAPLKPYYHGVFREARQSDRVLQVDYECSSPDKYRVYQMQPFPLTDNGGFLLVHSLRVNLAHRRKSRDPSDDRYLTPEGMVKMCCHCRRTRRASSETWDWVPSYLNQKAVPVTHGMCGICLAYFYPSMAERVREG